MPYTTTARQFFADVAPAWVASLSTSLQARVVFDIAEGGIWTIDFTNKSIVDGQAPPPLSAIVSAHAIDFMALVEGRMSADDGVLTGRLRLAGDAVAVGLLLELLASAKP
jgi:putative sterol carrier protein